MLSARPPKLNGTNDRPHSISRIADMIGPRFMPPYSSGVVIPQKPALRAFVRRSRSTSGSTPCRPARSLRSTSGSRGMTSLRMNARTVSRICRSSSVREKSTIARSSRTILESNSKIERPARPVKTAGSGPGRRPRPASLQLPAPAPSSTSPRWRAPALATVLFGSLRRTLAFDAAILRDLVRLPSGPPLRVASQRSVCLACQVGCVLLGGPPVATAAAGPVDRRLLGLDGRGVGLGGATGGQRGVLPRARLQRTESPWHRRRLLGLHGALQRPVLLRPPRAVPLTSGKRDSAETARTTGPARGSFGSSRRPGLVSRSAWLH